MNRQRSKAEQCPFRSCTAEVVCGGGGDGIFLKKVLVVWVFVGVCWLLFSFILEVVGVKMGSILVGFWGHVASLVALGAQFAPGPPGAFQGPPLFKDFGAQRKPKGVPK